MNDFIFTTEKMNSGGALFDINKLNDVSKDVLLRTSAKELCRFMTEWIREFKPNALKYLSLIHIYLRITELQMRNTAVI